MSAVREEFWIEPEWAQIHHPISARSTGSGRPTLTIDGLVLRFGSLLEFRCGVILAARPDFVGLRTQAEPVDYVSLDGKRRRHVFDLGLTLTGGRVLVAVKPQKVADRTSFENTLQVIAKQVPRERAEKVWLMTDRQAPQWKADNALDVVEAREEARDHPDLAVSEDATLRPLLPGIGSCILWSELNSSGVHDRAILRAISMGALKAGPGRYGPDTFLWREALHS